MSAFIWVGLKDPDFSSLFRCDNQKDRTENATNFMHKLLSKKGRIPMYQYSYWTPWTTCPFLSKGRNILGPHHPNDALSTVRNVQDLSFGDTLFGDTSSWHLQFHSSINCIVQVCVPRDHREGNTAVPAGGGRRTEAPSAPAAAVSGLHTGHRGRPVLH